MQPVDDMVGHLNNFVQMQQYQQKMSLEQVQDLANCIKILGNTLSFAENYSAMCGNDAKSEFTSYDYFYASKNTEKGLYFKKFAAAINNLDAVYDYYLSKYGEEPLPKSLPKIEIVKRLENYKGFIKDKKDQGLYDDLINVFSRGSIYHVKDEISKFKGDGTMEPSKISNTFLNAKGHVDQLNKDVVEKYKKNPNDIPDITMGASTPLITDNGVGGNRDPHPHPYSGNSNFHY